MNKLPGKMPAAAATVLQILANLTGSNIEIYRKISSDEKKAAGATTRSRRGIRRTQSDSAATTASGKRQPPALLRKADPTVELHRTIQFEPKGPGAVPDTAARLAQQARQDKETASRTMQMQADEHKLGADRARKQAAVRRKSRKSAMWSQHRLSNEVQEVEPLLQADFDFVNKSTCVALSVLASSVHSTSSS